jgi:23S rRNA pseudouridine955/2504/2580 synthase
MNGGTRRYTAHAQRRAHSQRGDSFGAVAFSLTKAEKSQGPFCRCYPTAATASKLSARGNRSSVISTALHRFHFVPQNYFGHHSKPRAHKQCCQTNEAGNAPHGDGRRHLLSLAEQERWAKSLHNVKILLQMNHLGNSAQAVRPDQVNLLTVNDGGEGQRLDNYLIRLLKGVPKSHIYRIVRGGEVRINGKRCAVSDRLANGDIVRVPPIRIAAPPDLGDISAQKRRFPHEILFEDDYLIAINKPAGTAVHGGSGVSFGVIEQLRMAREPGAFLELIHRLDRETSGVLMIAKTRPALLGVHELLREDAPDGDKSRKPDKRYLALVQGRVPNDRQHAKFALLKYVAPNNERRVRVDENAGQASHTIFNVVKRFTGTTLLEAELKSGRTHQIRVHLQHLGHVIAGDDKYGDFDWNKALSKGAPPLKRMFLHAASLRFPHPISDEPMTFAAPLPPELKTVLDAQT